MSQTYHKLPKLNLNPIPTPNPFFFQLRPVAQAISQGDSADSSGLSPPTSKEPAKPVRISRSQPLLTTTTSTTLGHAPTTSSFDRHSGLQTILHAPVFSHLKSCPRRGYSHFTQKSANQMRHTWLVTLHWLSILQIKSSAPSWVQKLSLPWLLPTSLTHLPYILAPLGPTDFLAVPGTSQGGPTVLGHFRLSFSLCLESFSPRCPQVLLPLAFPLDIVSSESPPPPASAPQPASYSSQLFFLLESQYCRGRGEGWMFATENVQSWHRVGPPPMSAEGTERMACRRREKARAEVQSCEGMGRTCAWQDGWLRDKWRWVRGRG